MIRIKIPGVVEIEAPDVESLSAAVGSVLGLRASVPDEVLEAESDLVEERDFLLSERATLQARIRALMADRDVALDDAKRCRDALKLANGAKFAAALGNIK